VPGNSLDAGNLTNSLRDSASTDIPFGGTLTAKEVCKGVVLSLEYGATLGTRECNDKGITSSAVGPILTAEVLSLTGSDASTCFNIDK